MGDLIRESRRFKDRLKSAAATTSSASRERRRATSSSISTSFRWSFMVCCLYRSCRSFALIHAYTVNTRGKLLPNPKEDAIVALFYCLQSEADDLVGNGREEDRHVGVIAVGTDELRRVVGPTNYTFEVVDSEHDLLNLWIDKIRAWDPEIVAGYETVHASWGYLLERADAAYGTGSVAARSHCTDTFLFADWRLVEELGRVTAQGTGRFAAKASDRRGFNELSFSGRHLLPIWQTLEADNRLQQYTFENVAFHMLRRRCVPPFADLPAETDDQNARRVPHFSSETLSKWYTSGVPHQVARVFEYWRDRVEMDVEMLDEGEVISQTWCVGLPSCSTRELIKRSQRVRSSIRRRL